MTIEQKIRAIMKVTGWKQMKLAEVFEVSQSTVNRWLRGAEPEGHRRDAINAAYAQHVKDDTLAADDKIRGDQEILAMLRRIDGLSPADIDVAFTVISDALALRANRAGSGQADAGDRPEPEISRRESTPSQ